VLRHLGATARRRRRDREARSFLQLVDEALDSIPPRFRDAMKNIAISSSEPSPVQLEEVGIEPPDTLLGLYEGTPLTERQWADGNRLPDKITLFQGPIEDSSDDREDTIVAIAETLIHEVGHYFGLSEEEIEEIEERYWNEDGEGREGSEGEGSEDGTTGWGRVWLPSVSAFVIYWRTMAPGVLADAPRNSSTRRSAPHEPGYPCSSCRGSHPSADRHARGTSISPCSSVCSQRGWRPRSHADGASPAASILAWARLRSVFWSQTITEVYTLAAALHTRSRWCCAGTHSEDGHLLGVAMAARARPSSDVRDDGARSVFVLVTLARRPQAA
jgi:predicted Zn-dependent protease with MMP-like domain